MNMFSTHSGSPARSSAWSQALLLALSVTGASGAVINGNLYVGNENDYVFPQNDVNGPQAVNITEPTQITGDVYVSHDESWITLPGVLTVTSGLTSDRGYIGFGIHGRGVAVVRGSNASWTTARELYVGHSAPGVLLVDKGAQVSSRGAFLGRTFYGSGQAVIADPGSRWVNQGLFQVGGQSRDVSTLSLYNGAELRTDQLAFMASSGAYLGGTVNTGATTVESGGSGLVASVSVGGSGVLNTPTLEVGAGTFIVDGFAAKLNSTSASLGTNRSGAAKVGVYSGGVWTNTGSIQVGGAGDADLTVHNRGNVNADTLDIRPKGRLVLVGETFFSGRREDASLSATLVLNGGVLEAKGFHGTIGALDMRVSSTLEFSGVDVDLAFADSSAFDWGANLLDVVGYSLSDGSSLRFGVNAAGLTAGQLSLFNFGAQGLGATIDAAGFVTPLSATAVPEPATAATLAALGALGIAGWWRRRREPARDLLGARSGDFPRGLAE